MKRRWICALCAVLLLSGLPACGQGGAPLAGEPAAGADNLNGKG